MDVGASVSICGVHGPVAVGMLYAFVCLDVDLTNWF